MFRFKASAFAAAFLLASSGVLQAETLNVIDVADPGFNAVFRGATWMVPVLEPLVRLDPKTRTPQSVLAQSWEVSDDFTSITFHLKSGVTFHDGTPFTAKNVVFSLDQAKLARNNAKARALAERITSIDMPDDLTVVIKFSKPTSSMWDLFYYTPMFDPATFAGVADGSDVNGTGPYTFASWKPGSAFTLDKYAGYRDAKEVHYDEIKVLVIGDSSAQQAALRSGRAQMAFGITARDAESLTHAKFKIFPGRPMTVGMGMNVSTPPFDNPLAREAVGYAVDRERLIKQANAGIGSTSDLFWSVDSSWTEEQAEGLEHHYTYDPEKAKELVKKAGVAGAEVPLIFPTNPVYLNYYNIIADGLRNAGFQPKAVQIETNEAVSRLLRGDLGPGYLYYDSTSNQSPVTVASDTPIFRTGDIGPQKYDSPEYKGLLKDLQNATSADYSGALEKLTRFVLGEAFNQAFVTVPTPIVISDKVDAEGDGSGAPVFDADGALTGLAIRPAS